MPKPIPEWDYFRVLLVYTLKKQAKLKPPTLKDLCMRLSTNSQKVQVELNEQSVEYTLVQKTEKYKLAGVELLIKSIPERLEAVFGKDNKSIRKQYAKLMRRKIKREPEPDWAGIRKAKREKIKAEKLRYFLREEVK